jgi:hypothetical protein
MIRSQKKRKPKVSLLRAGFQKGKINRLKNDRMKDIPKLAG